MVGTSQRQISKYEVGAQMPGAPVIIRIAKALECSTDFLLGLSDYPSGARGFRDLTAEEQHLIEMVRSLPPGKLGDVIEITRRL